MILCRFRPASWSDEFDYWRTLNLAWTRAATDDAIVNVEWDNEFSQSLVDDLLACPHPLCSHAYRMWVPFEYWAHSHSPDGIGGHWVREGEAWAAWSAIGFCKIGPEARLRPPARIDWRGVEASVNRAVRGPWHLHWGDGKGIEHYHNREIQIDVAIGRAIER